MVNEDLLTKQILDKLNTIEEQLKEVAFFANIAKNSATIQIEEHQVLTRLFTGQIIYLDSRDISLAPHLMMNGEWEMEITQLFRSLVKPDSVVFDIGANVGYFGIVAGTDIKTGEIHFFEANPDFIPLIKKSVEVNGLSKLSHINNFAVSNKDNEILELNFAKDFWGSSTLHKEILNVEVEKKIKVQTISLDSYCRTNEIKKVDIVKIDVEAHEESVFNGMQNVIKENPQMKLFLEYTLDVYSDKFFNTLKSTFNNVYAIVDNNLVKVDKEEELKELSNDWVMLFMFNN